MGNRTLVPVHFLAFPLDRIRAVTAPINQSDSPTTCAEQKRGPSLKRQRLYALILLICQGGITVTGSIVRVTGSGLGCDTWPHCQTGSFVPVAGAAPAIHQAIEFGNRLLTFVLVAAVIAVFVALRKAHRRAELMVYTLINALGVILQAVIGGISVHMDLKWWTVALHFLPSMVLVWVAAVLYNRILQPDDGAPTRVFSAMVRVWLLIATAALSVVLVTGTMTTGAGPHAGDDLAGLEGRLDVSIDLMAHIHGYSMYVYLAATVIAVALLYRQSAGRRPLTMGVTLVVFIVLQAAVGIAQYHMGVPRWTVPIHIGLCSFVVAITALLYANGKIRLRPGQSIEVPTSA